ncbi:MAG: hypothetical protein FWF50_02465 [Defluviitaleaceae bacterium]|nr:hypothetical protein [Defluviitaleaceae bacterium]
MIIDEKSYEDRIKRATPLELVKITYDIFFDYIAHAKKSPSIKIVEALSKVVDSLISSLNLDEQIGREILKTYIQVNAIFSEIKPKLHRKADQTKEIIELLNIAETHMKILHEGILKLKDTGEPIYNPKITAGLTYDKDGNLMELSQSTREFEA